jgi:enoyl-CoA hydratase/carnithine racemase
MNGARVRLAIVDGVAHLSFDHPRRMNAIIASMRQSLPGLLDEVAVRPEARAEKRAPRFTEE